MSLGDPQGTSLGPQAGGVGYRYHLLALLFGLFSGILGLILSYHNAVAAGPTIVLIAAALYFGTFFLREKGN